MVFIFCLNQDLQDYRIYRIREIYRQIRLILLMVDFPDKSNKHICLTFRLESGYKNPENLVIPGNAFGRIPNQRYECRLGIPRIWYSA